MQQVRKIQHGSTAHFRHRLSVHLLRVTWSLAPGDPQVPTLGEEQVCPHRGQPATSKWLTGAIKCNQVHISSTMIQRCNTGTASYGEYRYSQIWRIQVQWETPTVPHDSPASSPPLLVAVAQTLICPGRHYGSNMVTIIIPSCHRPNPFPQFIVLPLTVSANLCRIYWAW